MFALNKVSVLSFKLNICCKKYPNVELGIWGPWQGRKGAAEGGVLVEEVIGWGHGRVFRGAGAEQLVAGRGGN